MTRLDILGLAAFLCFCRFGAAIILMTSIGGLRGPTSFRLMLAIAVSAIAAIHVDEQVSANLSGLEGARLLVLVAGETVTGLVIGGGARLFYHGVEFGAAVIASSIGVSFPAPSALEAGQLSSALSELLSTMALAGIVASGGLGLLVVAAVQSYQQMPLGSSLDLRGIGVELGDMFRYILMAALQISSPFIAYSLMTNVLTGIVSRMVPQLPMQIVAGPLVIGGGLMLILVAGGYLMDRIVAYYLGGYGT